MSEGRKIELVPLDDGSPGRITHEDHQVPVEAGFDPALLPPKKPCLCLDFDRVIHSYTSGWRGADVITDPPVPGAIAALLGYIDRFTVCVHSSRFNRQNQRNDDHAVVVMNAARLWLVTHGVPVGKIVTFADYQPGGLHDDKINLVRTKPAALVTIDSCGWTFDGTFPSTEELLAFKPGTQRAAEALVHWQSVSPDSIRCRVTNAKIFALVNDSAEYEHVHGVFAKYNQFLAGLDRLAYPAPAYVPFRGEHDSLPLLVVDRVPVFAGDFDTASSWQHDVRDLVYQRFVHQWAVAAQAKS